MHGIPVDVKDEQLEQKVTDIFSNLNINIFKPGIEDCHRHLANLTQLLGLSIARFAKMHSRKSLRSIGLVIFQSLILKGRTNFLLVRI